MASPTRSGHPVRSALGVVLMALGGLVAVVVGVTLPGSTANQLRGGIVLVLAGLLVAGVGVALWRWGPRPGSSGRGRPADDDVRRVAIFEGLVVTLLLISAAAGVGLLASGSDPSAGAVFSAFAVFLVGVTALIEVGRRRGGKGAQYLAIGSGIVGAAAIMLTLGISGEDLRRLIQFGIASAAVAVATVASVRARS